MVMGKGYSGRIAGSSLEPLIREGKSRIINDLQDYLERKPSSDPTRLIVEHPFPVVDAGGESERRQGKLHEQEEAHEKTHGGADRQSARCPGRKLDGFHRFRSGPMRSS